MIGEAYKQVAVRAVLGPDRSQLVPSTLWLGWLDSDGDLIAMTGMAVPHETWTPVGDGVANGLPIDGGLAGDGWMIHALGLFDDADGGSLVAAAPLGAPITPAEGDPLVFAAGDVTFTYAGGA